MTSGNVPAGTLSAAQRASLHDLRNMLAVIRGYSQLLVAQTAQAPAELEEIARAADRAAALADELDAGRSR